MKTISTLHKKFQSSIFFKKYLPTLGIVFWFLLFSYYAYTQIHLSGVQNRDSAVTTATPQKNKVCPEDLDSDVKLTSFEKWANDFYDSNPDASLSELTEARHQFYVDNNCTITLERYEQVKSGKADPAIMDMISKEILEASKRTEVELSPTLAMPLRYFPSESFRSGTVGKSIDDKSTWKYAAIDIGYQSFPTTTITLSSDSYSNEIKELPPIKSVESTLLPASKFEEKYADASVIRGRRLAQIQEYGILALRFLPGDNIWIMGSFDVDDDGVDEMILAVCGDGGNHCPHKVIIIKGDKIIFSTKAGGTGPRIVTSGTSNGFYLQWAPWQPGDGGIWDVGLCCLPGYMKTRFVYEDGKFIPVYEQEVLYINVKNTEQ